MISLRFRPLDGPEQVLSVNKSKVMVGRGSNCDVVIVLEGISRQHCTIEKAPNGVLYITDLGSTNGVMINNQRLKPGVPTPYAPFHSLSIGSIPWVSIEMEAQDMERTVAAYRNSLNQISQETRTIVLDRGEEKKRAKLKGKPLAPKEPVVVDETNHQNVLLIGVALAALVGLSFYFFAG